MVEDRFFGRHGKAFEAGERLHPALEIGQDGVDLGLLAHEFGHDRAVDAGIYSPREWTFRVCIPREQGAPQRLDLFLREC